VSDIREPGTQPGVSVPRQAARDVPPEPSGWVGWVVFAGVMMIIGGIFQAIEGLVGIFDDTYYLVRKGDLLVSVSYTGWGWLHLVVGVVVALAGFALMAGRMWARVIGIVLAGVSAIVNMAFLSAYPIWATIIIAIDVLVIYALAVHGKEMQST